MAKRVLLVEDEDNIAVAVRFLLERAGFEVATAGDGEAGLDAARALPLNLIILDAMLPNLDGFEVLERLKADPKTASTPVLMLTAKGQAEDRERAHAAGADRFISKPFANADLVAAAEALATESEA